MRITLPLLALATLQLSAAAQTPCGTNGVTVTVDPPVAAVGQAILVTLTNNSGDTIQLPSSCVYGPVYPGSGCTSLPVYSPLCLTVLTPIAPGASVTSVWLQNDDFGQQVPSGPYSLRISYWDSAFTTLSSCCAVSTISGSCTPAGSTLRNGSGVNPVNLTGLAPPRLGLNWTTSLDCSAHAPGLAGLYVLQLPASGSATPFGELLLGGARYARFLQSHTSSTVIFSEPIPTDVALCGLPATAQGACLGSPGPRLSNALDLVLGN
jgi:hypothetical protein